MKIHYSVESLPGFKNTVITLGTFDGIHIGHKAIIERICKSATELNGESILVKFFPHPIISMQPDNKSIKIILSLEETINVLEQFNIDHLVVVNFTKSFSQQSATDYIQNFLVSKFHPQKIITGYNHHFGKDREGDINLLKQYESKYHYMVEEIAQQTVKNKEVSSSNIRKALSTGDIECANLLLGYPYMIKGIVVKGNQIGYALGFPTANIEVSDENKLIPADGVYAVYVQYNSNTYIGMLNIGYRPTFDGQKNTIEVHIFDFDKPIYNKEIEITFIALIRKEQKFDDSAALIKQLEIDKKKVLSILS